MPQPTTAAAYKQKATRPEEDNNIQIWLRKARAFKSLADRSKFKADKEDYQHLYDGEIAKVKARIKEFGVTPNEKEIERWMERA